MSWDWELIGCAVGGHATYRPTEEALAGRLRVETAAGTGWRCLRCGSFVPGEPSGHGPADQAPAVARGVMLRDLVIQRLLALDRLIHFLVLLTAGIVVIGLRHSQDALRDDVTREMPLLEPIAGQFGWHLDDSPTVRLIESSFRLSPTAITLIGTALITLGVLELVEAVGLWLLRRWGEYFSAVVTGVFIPVEIYELTERVSVLKVLVLAINVAAVLWLVWRKRLFGVRGGSAAYRAEHSAQDLLSVERAALLPATPPADVGARAAPPGETGPKYPV